jgi:hypothetical protein
MKNIFKKAVSLSFVLLAVVSLAGCTIDFGGNTNIDPNDDSNTTNNEALNLVGTYEITMEYNQGSVMDYSTSEDYHLATFTETAFILNTLRYEGTYSDYTKIANANWSYSELNGVYTFITDNSMENFEIAENNGVYTMATDLDNLNIGHAIIMEPIVNFDIVGTYLITEYMHDGSDVTSQFSNTYVTYLADGTFTFTAYDISGQVPVETMSSSNEYLQLGNILFIGNGGTSFSKGNFIMSGNTIIMATNPNDFTEGDKISMIEANLPVTE